MKRLLIGLVSIFFLLIAAVILVPSFMDWNQYKQTIVELAEKNTGYKIDLAGDLKISLLPSPEAYISNVTIQSPKSKKYDHLVKLERLDLNLAFAPLLSGKVEVTSLELVQPEIFVEAFADGSQSWQTDQLQAMMNKEGASDAGKEASATGGLDAIALNAVSISNGKLSYFEEASKAEQSVDQINIGFKADALSGPFSGKGSLRALNKTIGFEGKTGRLEEKDGSIAMNVTGSVAPENIAYSFAGILGFKDGLDLQGETEVSIPNLATFVGNDVLKAGALQTKGILTFKANSFEYQNANVSLINQKLKGNVKGMINPLKVDVDVSSQEFNLASVLKQANIRATNAFNFKGNIQSGDKGLNMNDFNLSLDDTKLSGSFAYVTNAARPLIDLDVKANSLDLNKFTAQQTSSESAGLEETLSGFELPFDLDVNLDIQNGIYQKYEFKNLKTVTSLKGQSLKIDQFSIGDFMGAEMSVQGAIDNLKNLQGIDVKASLKSNDFKKFAQILNVDTSSFPEKLNQGTLHVQAKGNRETLDTTVSLKAGGGEVTLAGNVNNALSAKPQLQNSELQIKHSNLNEFMNTVSPGFGNYANLSKPLNFYAKVEQSGHVYSFNEIKADLGGVSGQGSASIDLSNAKPQITSDLKLGDVVVKGGEKAAQSSGGVVWSRQAMPSAWMNSIDFDLKVAARSVDYQGWKMNTPSFETTLNNGIMTLKDLQGGLYDGQLFLNGDLRPFSKDGGYTISGAAKLRDVSFEPLLKSFAGNQILKGSGRINLDTNVSMAGLSASALMNGLKGDGVTSGKDIILDGFNLKRFARALSSDTKPGDTVLGLYKTSIKGGQTRFDEMDGQFDIQEGVININTLNMNGPEAFLSTTGKIDLPKFQIATTHEITLNEEEDIPSFKININGPLNNPTQTFGQGLLNDYISRKVSRKLQDVISDKLGSELGIPGLGGGPRQQPSSNTNDAAPANDNNKELKPEDALKGLLKGILQ